jgi:hypothetical protein
MDLAILRYTIHSHDLTVPMGNLHCLDESMAMRWRGLRLVDVPIS